MSPAEVAGTIRLATARLSVGPNETEPTFAARRAADAIEVGSIAFFGFLGEHEMLNAVRDLVDSAEGSDLPHDEVEALRLAYGEACTLFDMPIPPEGEENRHEPKC